MSMINKCNKNENEDDIEDVETELSGPSGFNWIDGQDEPKVIQTNLMQAPWNPLEHQVIENPQPKNFEWVDAQSKGSLTQQFKAPEADDIETAQDEEAAADREQDAINRDERSTVD